MPGSEAVQPGPRMLNWMATICHPAGWRTHTWLSRTASSIGSPRHDARLRWTQRTIAASLVAGRGAGVAGVPGRAVLGASLAGRLARGIGHGAC